MDEKVFEKLKEINKDNKNQKESIFPEHEFLVTCLRMGLKIDDLKILTYVDVLKILISFCEIDENMEENEVREATQEEIQSLVARM